MRKPACLAIALLVLCPWASSAAENCPYLDMLRTLDKMAELTAGGPAKSLVKEGYCPSGIVEVKSDRFSGLDSASTSMVAGDDMEAVMVWSSERPDAATLVFSGTASDWRYLRCHSTFVLADGARVPVGEASHHGEAFTGGVVEQVIVSLPLASVTQLAGAKTMEFKICNDEMTSSACFLCEVKNLLRAVQAWKLAHPQAAPK